MRASCRRGNRPSVAFAAYFLGLSLATIGITAPLFAFDYRQYYSTWHEEAFTVTWMFQFVFTTAGALVQFAVLGVRLYFPLGFLALFVASSGSRAARVEHCRRVC